ncbi:MAG: adenylate/guanylate cyclase domain-containing protein [Armatimonadota bacterium]|nr:adenylate/guanylate cyclase domain-containing protein [Armatimonadota bacterium]MDR7507711.1 adenylate/guanylate cyclase domain-containing protein [Armatimonadota bacterium]MDR7510164.1 adenylate/guanylate cyclase domain-containing protein [Armatimonadota bacterium]MDR7559669.1 adenylate/guanylate cyclase domain-containing protein [Armatimonadota bacterium]MDR7583287.1 adenylate/guanylate cyclase domain-containing protein [Armatimonadota bacterium]
MSARPAGTVTFLFADIEGSTELLQQLGDAAYTRVLAGYRALMRRCSVRQRGYPVDSPGDTFFAVFAAPRDAVAAAVAMQAALARHRWPRRATVRARVGLHTGTAVPTRRGYAGVDVHRAARICAAGYGGQILLSEATAVLVAGTLPAHTWVSTACAGCAGRTGCTSCGTPSCPPFCLRCGPRQPCCTTCPWR